MLVGRFSSVGSNKMVRVGKMDGAKYRVNDFSMEQVIYFLTEPQWP